MPRSRVGAVAGGLLLLAALALLAACGAGNVSSPSSSPTNIVGGPRPTATATDDDSTYLFSRIDYPLELAVNTGSTVTLTLSPHQDLLAVTPSPGSGVETGSEPIPLPTRLSDYNDIGVSVDTLSSGDSPVVWQLISAPRQTLLTPGGPDAQRSYLRSVDFQWHVQAISPGQNQVRIILHLYYIYLDGSEQDGNIEVSSAPTPIIAMQASIANTTLPTWVPSWLMEQLATWRLPLAGLSGLAGLLGVLRFIWDLLQNAKDAKEAAEGAAKAAVAIHAHVSQRRHQPR